MASIQTTKEMRPKDYLLQLDEFYVRRVSDLSVQPNLSTQDIGELGTDAIIESPSDTITCNVSFTVNADGTNDLFQKLMGEKAATPWKGVAGTYSGIANSGTVTQADFENACVDVIIPMQENDILARTKHIPNCYLTNFEMTFNAEGLATESYTLVGDIDADYYGAWRDMRVAVGWYNATTAATGFVCSGITAFSGFSAVDAIVDNIVVATGQNITMGAANGNVFWSPSTFSGVAGSSRCRILYYKDTPDTFQVKRDYGRIGTPGWGGIFGRQVKMYLGASDITGADSERTLRVQSVSISGDLSREEQRELGSYRVVNKRLTTPLRITATVDVSENDLEVYARLIGGDTYTAFSTYKSTADYAQKVKLATDMLQSNNKLIVKVYQNRSESASPTLMRTITMSGLTVTAKNTDASSTGRGTLSFSLQGSYLTSAGAGLATLPSGI